MKMRVKFFSEERLFDLQAVLNEFLAKLDGINVVDIKLRNERGSNHLTAMVMYAEKKQAKPKPTRKAYGSNAGDLL